MKPQGKNALLGVSIIALSIGATNSLKFVVIAYYAMIISTLLVGYAGSEIIFEKKHSLTNKIILGLGVVVLFFFLGVQSPQLQFKQYFWILGAAFIVPFIYQQLRKVKLK